MISIAICDDDSTYIQKTFKSKIYAAQKIAGIDIQVSFFFRRESTYRML